MSSGYVTTHAQTITIDMIEIHDICIHVREAYQTQRTMVMQYLIWIFNNVGTGLRGKYLECLKIAGNSNHTYRSKSSNNSTWFFLFINCTKDNLDYYFVIFQRERFIKLIDWCQSNNTRGVMHARNKKIKNPSTIKKSTQKKNEKSSKKPWLEAIN